MNEQMMAEQERQLMRQQMLGAGMAGRAGGQLQAVPASRDAAINAQVQGVPGATPTPQELAMAQAQAPQPPNMLQKIAAMLRGSSR